MRISFNTWWSTKLKLIISNSSTKRIIKGGFKICGTKGDLLHMADIIIQKLKDEDFSFGWIDIWEPLPIVGENSKPEPWDIFADDDIEPSLKEVLRLEREGKGYAGSDVELK